MLSKKLFLSLSVLVSLALFPVKSVFASEAPITVYQNNQFEGQAQVLQVGTYNINQLTVGNDEISSLKVTPGYKVTLYKDADFSGDSMVFTSDSPNLDVNDFNDETSSIKVEYDPTYTPPVTLFKDNDFEGNSQVLSEGKFNYDTAFPSLNDEISSIKVKVGYKVTLFENKDLQGKSAVLTTDEPKLGDLGMNDTVSSILVEKVNPVDSTAIAIKDLNNSQEKANILKTFAPRIYMDKNEKYMPSSIDYVKPFVDRVYDETLKKPIYTTKEKITDPTTKLDYFKGDLANAKLYSFWVDKGDYVDLTYWEFSPYNWGKTVYGTEYGNHVGDWEHVTVRLYKFTQDGITYVKPNLTLLSYHAWMGKSSFNTMTKVDGTHPVVYCANGSHGMYKSPGEHVYINYVVVVLSDVASQGAQWDTWNSLVTLQYDTNTQRGTGLGSSAWPVEFVQGDDYSMESGAVYQWGNNKIPDRRGIFSIEDEFGSGPVSPSHQFGRD